MHLLKTIFVYSKFSTVELFKKDGGKKKNKKEPGKKAWQIYNNKRNAVYPENVE